MKTQLLVSRSLRGLKRMLVSVAVALLLVMGWLLASILLSPLDAPVHVLNAPSVAASQLPSKGVAGTLASFTALIPETAVVYLPDVER
jgi:hypothetical protein